MKKSSVNRKRIAVCSVFAALSLAFAAEAAQSGWVTEGESLRFVEKDGSYAVNQWKKKDGEAYYLNEKGEIAKNTWVDGIYYVGEDGKQKKNDWFHTDKDGSGKEAWYYFGRDGKAESNDWKKIGTGRYCFDATGKMRTGWYYEDGEIYYLGDEDEGYTRSGWYYLESNGVSLPAAGSISADLEPGEKGGHWYSFTSDGKARKAESGDYKEVNLDGKRYYFNELGIMETGWHHIEGKHSAGDNTGIGTYVYLGDRDDGVMKNQWLETKERPWDTKEWDSALDEGQRSDKSNLTENANAKKTTTRRFYLKNDGTPAFLSSEASSLGGALVKIGAYEYFFDSYGVMRTGLIRFTADGRTETALFDEDGKRVTGRVVETTDKNGKAVTFCSGASGSEKGLGVNGEFSGSLYAEGVLVKASAKSGLEAFEVAGKWYLVDTNGKIQKEEKLYTGKDNRCYLIAAEGIWESDSAGAKGAAVTTGGTLPKTGWHLDYQW